MHIYISQVGLQPSACAVSAKTLFYKTEYGLDKIILLYTSRSQRQAERLKRYFDTWKDKAPDIELLRFPEAEDDPDAVIDAFSGYINEYRHFDNDVYLDVSPGRNVEIALLGEVFRQNIETLRSWTPVYADDHYLYSLNSDHRWKLESIGIKEMLELYGYSSDLPSLQEQQSTPWCNNLRLNNEFSAIYAYEHKGKLFALCRLEDFHPLLQKYEQDYNVALENNENEKLIKKHKKKFNQALLHACRKLLRFHTDHEQLNFLRPRLSLWTSNPVQHIRFRTYGLYSFLKTKKGYQDVESVFQAWLDLNFADKRDATSHAGRLEGYHYIHMANLFNAENNVLLIALGTDPSATLTALFTFKPIEVFIFYDQSTPTVSLTANRLKNVAGNLPVEHIHLVPTDILGRLSSQVIFDNIKTANPVFSLVINPGTKAQTWSLSTMKLDLYLWSLNNHKGVLMPLDPDLAYRSKQYILPPVEVQASACGGSLKYSGKPWKTMINQQQDPDFLYYSMLVISSTLSADPDQIGKLFNLKQGTNFGVSNKRFQVDEVIIKNNINYFYLTTEYNDFTANGFFESPLIGDGHSHIWFEQLVAGYLVKIFKNRKNFDLRWSLEWPNIAKRNLKRTEIDIVMSYDNCFLGISCKLGVKKAKPDIEAAKSEIMSEAKENLGRFAIPLLVRGDIFPYHHAKQLAQDSIYSEPLELGVCLFNNEKYCIDIINRYIIERRIS